MNTQFIINHLWQSSCFVLLAALLAFVLRKNSPKIRYWVWLSASLKFLVPFVLLVNLGSLVPRPVRHSVPVPVFPNTLVQIAEPFSPPLTAAVPVQAPVQWMPAAFGIVWFLGLLAIAVARCRSWFRVRTVVQAGTPIELPIPIPALITPGAAEPGIVGFFGPVLVLPNRLLERLNPRQLDAILTHEMWHVRRRDNLFAAVHMAVEAIFWFNPLVWWVGSRLIEERELACDEEVLRMGCEPSDYIEGILQVCRLHTESPLPCISGVTGADVKKRLHAILTGTIAHEMNIAKKVALAMVALATLAVPIVVGVLNAPAIRTQNAASIAPKFEVASIRACKDPSNGPAEHSSPGSLATDCHELLNLIGNAYNAFADGHLNMNAEPAPINGGPPWLQSAAYDINAKAEGHPSVAMMLGPMMQRLLEDRFQLKIHRETREGPVYFLTVARGGPKLHLFTEGSCTPWATPPPPLQPGTKYCGSTVSGISASAEALGVTLDEFSKTLRVLLDRPVIDKTGITGRFDIRVKFSREGTELAAFTPRTVGGAGTVPFNSPVPAAGTAGSPSIFTALQEQLGLRLEAGKGHVDTLVIDHIEMPSGDGGMSSNPIETKSDVPQIASTRPVLPRLPSPPPVRLVDFQVCKESTTWTRPAPELQAKIWNDPRYSGLHREAQPEWTHKFLGVPVDSASIQYDVENLSGLWTEGTFSPKCNNDKLNTEWVEVWLMLHRVQSIEFADGVYTIHVDATEKGFQSILMKRLAPDVTLRFVDESGRLLDEIGQ